MNTEGNSAIHPELFTLSSLLSSLLSTLRRSRDRSLTNMNLHRNLHSVPSHSTTCVLPRPVTFTFSLPVNGCPPPRDTNVRRGPSLLQPGRVLGTTNRRQCVSRGSARDADYVEVKVDAVSVSLGACVVFLRLIATPEGQTGQLVLPVHVGGCLERSVMYSCWVAL